MLNKAEKCKMEEYVLFLMQEQKKINDSLEHVSTKEKPWKFLKERQLLRDCIHFLTANFPGADTYFVEDYDLCKCRTIMKWGKIIQA